MKSAIEFTDGSGYNVSINFIHTTFDMLEQVDKFFFMGLKTIPVRMRQLMNSIDERGIKVTICLFSLSQNGTEITLNKGFAFCATQKVGDKFKGEQFSRLKGRRKSLTKAIAHLSREYRRMVWHKYFEWESVPVMRKRGKILNAVAEELFRVFESHEGIVCRELEPNEARGSIMLNPDERRDILSKFITILDNSGID